MSDLEKIKVIADQMPESSEKQLALQAYSNLKTFEIIADSLAAATLERTPKDNSNFDFRN